MVFPILGANTASAEDLITNSCQFNTDAYCEFTPSSGSGSTQFTYSAWIKNCGAGALSETGMILSGAGAGSGADNGIQLSAGGSNGKIQFIEYDGGDNAYYIRTNRLFRDPNAWFHLVLIYDAPDGTAGDRMRLYINGTRETSFSNEVQLPQNRAHAGFTRNNVAIRVGAQASGSNQRFNGYLADVHFCDGQNYEPSEFGETNDNGVWVPKETDVSYGTNGFRLQFKETGTSANASGIGADTSGNGNHFSVSGLAATNITTDTPQNNFCTFNSLYASNTQTNGYVTTLSEGNLRAVSTAAGKSSGISSFGVANGKWYAEFKQIAFSSSNSKNYSLLGVHSDITPMIHNNPNGNGVLGYSPHGYAYWAFNSDGSTAGYKMNDDDSSSNYGDAWGTNDIIGIALDLDNNAIYVSKNGTWQASSDPESGASRTNAMYNLTAASSTPDGLYFMVVGDSGSSQTGTWEANFGNAPFSISSGNSDGNGHGNFEYAVPSGYFALCTKNLAEYG